MTPANPALGAGRQPWMEPALRHRFAGCFHFSGRDVRFLHGLPRHLLRQCGYQVCLEWFRLLPGGFTFPPDAVGIMRLPARRLIVGPGQDVENVNFGWWYKFGTAWGSTDATVFGHGLA